MGAAATAGLSLAGTQLGPLVKWLAQVFGLPVPPDDVAAVIGVMGMTAVHAGWGFAQRWAAPSAPVPVPVQAPVAPVPAP